MNFSAADDTRLRAMLAGVKTIAVVGYSPKPQRPSHAIARGMQLRGFRIVPVRPGISDGLGEAAYADLEQVPAAASGGIDLVNVFRNGAEVMPVVDACIRLGLKKIWMQEGCINDDAAQKAHDAGMQVVMDRCILRDYKRLGLDGAA
jgi:predicted CoA-binding protein